MSNRFTTSEDSFVGDFKKSGRKLDEIVIRSDAVESFGLEHKDNLLVLYKSISPTPIYPQPLRLLLVSYAA